MEDPIEINLATKDGIIDCRIEAVPGQDNLLDMTLLYPFTGNQYGRSEIYNHLISWNETTHSFQLDDTDTDIHPKIKALENEISKALINVLNRK